MHALVILSQMYKAKCRHYSRFLGSDQSYEQSSCFFSISRVLRWQLSPALGQHDCKRKNFRQKPCARGAANSSSFLKIPLGLEVVHQRADEVGVSGLEVQHGHSLAFRRGRKDLPFSLLAFLLLY